MNLKYFVMVLGLTLTVSSSDVFAGASLGENGDSSGACRKRSSASHKSSSVEADKSAEKKGQGKSSSDAGRALDESSN